MSRTKDEADMYRYVCTANNWESADLGDEERKQRFLRLMGGAKEKPHKGRFVIGETEKPAHVHKTDAKHLTEDLEAQFIQGIEHRQLGGKRGHIGLGFHEENTEQKCEEEAGEENGDSKDKDENKDVSEKPSEKSKKTESQEEDEPSPKKTKLDNPEAS